MPTISRAATSSSVYSASASSSSSSSRVAAAGEARVVVAVDFGTTFSGFAYAKTSDPDDVFKVYEWPAASSAGAKPYCKTQTSLFYAPPLAPGLPFQLLDWGWSSLLSYTKAARSSAPKSGRSISTAGPSSPLFRSSNDFLRFGQLPAVDHPTSTTAAIIEHANVDLALPPELAEKIGFFATKFKLLLAPDADQFASELPRGLTAEQLVVDYLRCLSSFIISELQVNYGKQFGMRDVQWCLTVPAIWDERAKQVMKVCAEKAGMVKGGSCPISGADPSPFPLGIILEPEAASVYCQHKAKALKLMQGDKLLVVDVGGGTIDLVVHRKADNDPKSFKVDEVVGSYGDTGGGTFVDAEFLQHLCSKIGCFKEFCRVNTPVMLKIFEWWQGVKAGFDGEGFSAQFSLPRKLSEAWEDHDRRLGIQSEEDDYEELRLEDTEIAAIFDPEVQKVIGLIERHVQGVRVLMVVGGFSSSPYLRKCIQRAFCNRVEDVIVPEDPGSAICHGAALLHMKKDIIQSRISRRTYGIWFDRDRRDDDPLDLLYVDDDGNWKCKDCLDVFVKVGDRVFLNQSIKRSYVPIEHLQQNLCIGLYSSLEKYPKYTREVSVLHEGSFTMDISEGLELGKSRLLEVTMVFGSSLIDVSAERVNFGKAGNEGGLLVEFEKA
ncbi:hypothetical protein L7F22_002428 [Adiantum nelumboides]|nr:hypothetical protein [Adiantum nelumboides]